MRARVTLLVLFLGACGDGALSVPVPARDLAPVADVGCPLLELEPWRWASAEISAFIANVVRPPWPLADGAVVYLQMPWNSPPNTGDFEEPVWTSSDSFGVNYQGQVMVHIDAYERDKPRGTMEAGLFFGESGRCLALPASAF